MAKAKDFKFCTLVVPMKYYPWHVELLPRNALQCKARSCYPMWFVRPSVCPSVTLVDHDHIG